MNKNIKTALIIGGVLVAILIIVPLIFGLIGGWQGYGYGYGMMGPGMMGGFGTMGIIWIVVLGLIIWAVVTAVHRPGESDSPARSADSALEILKRRYVRGDINKQEYEERKKDLT